MVWHALSKRLQENIKQILDHCMSNHEISVRQLAQNPISGSRFVAFLQRWEINHEPPPELDHDYEKKYVLLQIDFSLLTSVIGLRHSGSTTCDKRLRRKRTTLTLTMTMS